MSAKIIVAWRFLVVFVCFNSVAILAALQPFNGNIGFVGDCTMLDSSSFPITDSDFSSAVAFGSFINVDSFTEASGIYTNVPNFSSASFTPFSFNLITPVNPLWVFTNSGSIYSFELTSVHVSFVAGSFLDIQGTGIAHVDGFADTPGFWTFECSKPTADGFDTYSFRVSTSVNSTNIPTLSIMPPTNGMIMINWNALAGQPYQLQCTTNLTQNNWSNLGAAVATANSTISTSDTFEATDQKFYRVVLVQ
ncbi:MAG TPA: hypothetical protein VFC85_06450 [Verrucomicrobiae bacterium]|nr:hypothetical protein [Verrucomicrobiae bacterium]